MEMTASPFSRAKGKQVRQAHESAPVVDDLADHARRSTSGEARQVDGGLGMAGAGQDTAFARAQRKDVPGPGEARRIDVPVAAVTGQRPDGPRPILRRNACGGAETVVHGNREGRTVLFGVVLHHLRQLEFIEAFSFHGNADDAGCMTDKEGDQFRRRLPRPP